MLFGKFVFFGVVMIFIVLVYIKFVFFFCVDYYDCICELMIDIVGFFILNFVEKKIKNFLDFLCFCVFFYYVLLLWYFLKFIEN